MVKNGIDVTSVEGAANSALRHPQPARSSSPRPRSACRCCGGARSARTHTAYAIETFLDELAEAAGKDPVEFRLRAAEGPSAPRRRAEAGGGEGRLGHAAPEGRFRGVAVHESFDTLVAQVAEISLGDDGGVKVRARGLRRRLRHRRSIPTRSGRRWKAASASASAPSCKSELTLTGGAVDQANFDGYTSLRIDEMPEVEVHIVPSDRPPTGVGEPGVPPIGPAVANAIYNGTKKRVRVLPVSKNDLTSA